MILILGSYEDIASENIFRHLLTMADFKKISENLYIYDNFYLRMISEPLIYAENIDERIAKNDGIDFEEIIFISRHKSESGKVSLTVHPVGNFGDAKYGGKPGMLSPTNPATMLMLLRNLYSKFPDITSYEVTHHGPLLNKDACFVEIGSDENAWRKDEYAEVIAESVLNIREMRGIEVYVGIGGGHYAPRFTEISVKEDIAFGHMVSKYYVSILTEDLLKQAIEKTRNCDGICIHKKSVKSEDRKRIINMAEKLGAKVVLR